MKNLKNKISKIHINKNIIFNFIFNFTMLFLVEIIFKLVNFFNIFDWSILRIILSTSIISIIVSCILYLIPKKIHKYINILLVLIASIYALVQTGFNNYIGVYMSLGVSSQLGAVLDYIKEFISSFNWYYYFCLVPLVVSIVYYIFFNKKITKKFKLDFNTKIKEINKRVLIQKSILCAFFITLVAGSYFGTLITPFMQNKLQTVSNRKLFNNPNIPSVAIKQFGITEFGILDVKNYIIPNEEKEEIELIIDEDKKEKENKKDDTKWESLIENEKNNTLNTLNKFFINNDETSINEYTGKFKDKNLIVIMMESVNDIIINEEYFPNFYKLYSEGWHWENNFSPRNSCATGNNEMSGMIGLYSIYNTCTANNYKYNIYNQSIFNLFNNSNYYTFSAHNYSAHYYDRDRIHKNMGSQEYYSVEELGIPWSSQYKNWASDEDFMESVLNILDEIETENYMTWLTTVSSHQPYSVSSNEGDRYLSEFKDLNVRIEMKRYMSKLKILDNGLGILLKGLEERNKLDDTVIVLFGDHYPYGLNSSIINSVLDYDITVDYDAERVPFVIYNSKEEPKVFKEYTSYLNIVPTVANLFGLEYDSRHYVGKDILSKEYKSLVVFADGFWENEKAYYDASKGNIKYYGDDTYTVEEIQEINKKIELDISMSGLAIKNNYFNYLYNSLNNLEINEVIKEESSNKES